MSFQAAGGGLASSVCLAIASSAAPDASDTCITMATPAAANVGRKLNKYWLKPVILELPRTQQLGRLDDIRHSVGKHRLHHHGLRESEAGIVQGILCWAANRWVW